MAENFDIIYLYLLSSRAKECASTPIVSHKENHENPSFHTQFNNQFIGFVGCNC